MSSIALLTVGLALITFRKDLIAPAIINALIMGILGFIMLVILGVIYKGIFDAWWQIKLLSGIRIFSVPIEELIWHASLGFAAGPMYEVYRGYKDYKIKRS